MDSAHQNEWMKSIDKLHTTELGVKRMKCNLSLDVDDIVSWCQEKIQERPFVAIRKGKNWYIEIDDFVLTVNAHSYTIITAHKKKK